MSAARPAAEVRARAAQIVRDVVEGGRSLDALLDVGQSHPERSLLRFLSYGTVRWYFRLNEFLRTLSGDKQLSPEVRALSLVGLFQLLYTDIAAHAAVAETVNAAHLSGQQRAAGLINAVLRRCQREGATIATQIDQDLPAQTAHPGWLVTALKRDWPHEYRSILDANNVHPPMWLRVNRRQMTREAYLQSLQALRIEANASEVAPDAVKLEVPMDVRSLPGFAEGAVSVQDGNAQLAAHLLGAHADDRVLDACAAPGGKTCHLLELQPSLQLLAIDIAAPRLEKIKQNLQRLKLSARVITADAAEPAGWWDGLPFDRILLDVPCSATGVIRRHPDIKVLRREADIAAMAARQAELLDRLWPLLRSGGKLLYVSCSVLRAENAAVICDFLDKHAEAADETMTALTQCDFPAANVRPGPGYALAVGEAGGDGFYYACLQKS